ncbi:MAG: hypothetical protein WAS07_01485 [Micropruina sp.]
MTAGYPVYVELLPSASETDWVTYADHLVAVRVDSESRLPISKDELASGEGLIGRELSMTVLEVTWSRPGTSVAAPRTLTWAALGWTFGDKGERQMRLNGAPWIEVGHDYLIPITFIPKGDQGALLDLWTPLGLGNQLPFDQGVIGRGEAIRLADGSTYTGAPTGGGQTVRDRAWGKGAAELVALLRAAKPDPAAASDMDLPPLSRYAATQAA